MGLKKLVLILCLCVSSLVTGLVWSQGNQVHPSYDLLNVRPDGWEPLGSGGIKFLPDGRMVFVEWGGTSTEEQQFTAHLMILTGVEGARNQIKIDTIASGLSEALGLALGGDTIYITERHQLTRFVPDENNNYQ